MKLDFFIAKKFLISLRKIKIIHLINIITLAGITIGSTALILSSGLYNGLEGLVMQTLKSVEPDIRIGMRDGKVFSSDLVLGEMMQNLDGIEAMSEVFEEKALLINNRHSTLAHMQGVRYVYGKEKNLQKFIIQSSKDDYSDDENTATVGAGLALSLNLRHRGQAIMVISSADILRAAMLELSPHQLEANSILVDKIFSIDKQHDERYIITPLKFAQQVAGAGNRVSYLGVYAKTNCNVIILKKKLEGLLDGQRFLVSTIYERETALLRAIRTEKLCTRGIFLIILLIAALNVLFSTMMFFLIKRQDLCTLSNLGVPPGGIKRIIAIMGLTLSIVGVSLGAILAYGLQWIQSTYKIISLGGNVSIADAYPIEIHLGDVAYTFVAVVIATLLVTLGLGLPRK